MALDKNQIKALQKMLRMQRQTDIRKKRKIDPASLRQYFAQRLPKTKALQRGKVSPLQLAAKGGSMSLRSAFREVNRNEPKAVTKTRKKHGSKRAQKQKIAIAYSKAGRSKRAT
jgi:hypothetical protein